MGSIIGAGMDCMGLFPQIYHHPPGLDLSRGPGSPSSAVEVSYPGGDVLECFVFLLVVSVSTPTPKVLTIVPWQVGVLLSFLGQ